MWPLVASFKVVQSRSEWFLIWYLHRHPEPGQPCGWALRWRPPSCCSPLQRPYWAMTACRPKSFLTCYHPVASSTSHPSSLTALFFYPFYLSNTCLFLVMELVGLHAGLPTTRVVTVPKLDACLWNPILNRATLSGLSDRGCT